MKIFIHPHTSNNFQVKWCCPRTELIVSEGLSKIKEVELVDSDYSADYVIWHHVPQFGGQKSFELINQIDPKKLIVIDSIDENNEYFVQEMSPDNYFLYFKRSLVKQNNNVVRQVIPTISRQYPWDYAILDGFIQPAANKTIDVGCYLRNSCYYRSLVIQNMMHWFHQNQEKYLIYIGEVSQGSRSDSVGNVVFDKVYFNYLAKTKIIVSSGPYGWCGDSRGCEAVANRCAYISNEFLDLMPNTPIPNEEWLKFNPLDANSLFATLDWILEKPYRLFEIANNGYEQCMKYHTSLARMKYVLEKIEENA